MSGTQLDLKWTIVVEDCERLPPWLTELAEQTRSDTDDLVRAMIGAEMTAAGEKFIARFPELFRPGTGLV